MADKEIRTILAPLTNGHMLLPNSAVAEVLGYTQPEPFLKSPNWLLGELAWHGWQVPVICLEQVVNRKSRSSVTPKSRILVIKTLGESTQVNYIGLMIQGLPKLKTITADSLKELQTDDLPDALFSEVSVDDQKAVIPELGELAKISCHCL